MRRIYNSHSSYKTTIRNLCWVANQREVVKVNNTNNRNTNDSLQDKYDKFDHQRKDPDFKQFLSEMVMDQLTGNQHKEKSGSKKARGETQITPKLIKSPSDTTIYSPGLRKIHQDNVLLIEKISQFVESIRLEDSDRSRSHKKQHDQND